MSMMHLPVTEDLSNLSLDLEMYIVHSRLTYTPMLEKKKMIHTGSTHQKGKGLKWGVQRVKV